MYIDFNGKKEIVCDSDAVSESVVNDLKIILKLMKSSKNAVLLGDNIAYKAEEIQKAIDIIQVVCEQEGCLITLEE